MMVEEDGSIRTLVSRLIDDGKAYAKAEIDLVRLRVEDELVGYRRAAIFAGIGAVFGASAIVCLCLTLVLTLAGVLGPLLGGLLATVLVGAISGLLIYFGYRNIEKKDG